MTRFALPYRSSDFEAQENAQALLAAVNQLAQFVSFGDGVPAHTPVGPQVWFNRTGGNGTAIYFWDTASWTAVA